MKFLKLTSGNRTRYIAVDKIAVIDAATSFNNMANGSAIMLVGAPKSNNPVCVDQSPDEIMALLQAEGAKPDKPKEWTGGKTLAETIVRTNTLNEIIHLYNNYSLTEFEERLKKISPGPWLKSKVPEVEKLMEETNTRRRDVIQLILDHYNNVAPEYFGVWLRGLR